MISDPFGNVGMVKAGKRHPTGKRKMLQHTQYVMIGRANNSGTLLIKILCFGNKSPFAPTLLYRLAKTVKALFLRIEANSRYSGASIPFIASLISLMQS